MDGYGRRPILTTPTILKAITPPLRVRVFIIIENNKPVSVQILINNVHSKGNALHESVRLHAFVLLL